MRGLIYLWKALSHPEMMMFWRELWQDLFSPSFSWHGGSSGWSREALLNILSSPLGTGLYLNSALPILGLSSIFIAPGAFLEEAFLQWSLEKSPLNVFSQRWTLGISSGRNHGNKGLRAQGSPDVLGCVSSHRLKWTNPLRWGHVVRGPCLAVGTHVALEIHFVSRESPSCLDYNIWPYLLRLSPPIDCKFFVGPKVYFSLTQINLCNLVTFLTVPWELYFSFSLPDVNTLNPFQLPSKLPATTSRSFSDSHGAGGGGLSRQVSSLPSSVIPQLGYLSSFYAGGSPGNLLLFLPLRPHPGLGLRFSHSWKKQEA